MAKKIRSITGMSDILPGETKYWNLLEETARKIFNNYHFSEIRTPILEETPLFSRGIGEGSQVVQKEMYTFLDKGGDSVTMRPEGTASVVRSYIQHSLQASDEITKLYYMGPMFRYERPQKGRLRQFHQIGAETFGVDHPLADAEVVIMLDRLIKELGITEYKIAVNTLGSLEERKPYLEKLTNYFLSDKEGLCEDCHKRLESNVLRIFDCKVEACKQIALKAPVLIDSVSPETKSEFDTFLKALDQAGVQYEVSPRIVRGLDYYVKTTFEFVSDRLGSQSAFAGGGRYNGLVEDLGGKPTPAVGFALGCERVILLMKEFESSSSEEKEFVPGVYFIPMDEKSFTKSKILMQNLRDGDILSEMAFEKKSLKSQMRRANKFNFKYAAIIGSDELEKGVVMLKDLEKSEQHEVKMDDLLESIRK